MMHIDFKMVAEIIKKDAPLLAAIVGQANPVAGIFINLIAAAFGANNHDELVQKINSDADKAIKLQQLEADHQTMLQHIDAMDRNNARGREVDFIKAGNRDYFINLIAIIFIVAFFFVALIMYFQNIDDDPLFDKFVEQLNKSTAMIISYYF